MSKLNNIQITQDEFGIGAALEKLLKKASYKVKLVDQVNAQADGVIFLNALQKINDVQSALAINYQAFNAAKIMANNTIDQPGLFISVQNNNADFSFNKDQPQAVWCSGLSGLIKTLGYECPQAQLKAIDINVSKQKSAVIAKRLFTEITHIDDHYEIGLAANGERITLSEQAVAVCKGSCAIKQDSVLVVTGGAKGITADCLIALSRRLNLKLVLLGRSKLEELPPSLQNLTDLSQIQKILFQQMDQEKLKLTPNDIKRKANKVSTINTIRATLNTLITNGSEATYVSCDVQSLDAMQTACETVRKQYGRIDGIVHGAGVLADRLVIDKTAEQFDRVFATKTQGLYNLLQATQQDDLQLIALFSSVAARFGNKGQADYAMANEVLNKVGQQLQQQRGKSCLVKAYNWGPWDSGMVNDGLKKHFASQGITLIPKDQGTQMFIDELYDTKEKHTEVVLGAGFKPNKQPLPQQITINKIEYPFLTSHKINNQIVIPICLVLEWFAKTIVAASPAFSCKDLRVLNGIKLTNFAKQDDIVNINCEQVQNTQTYQLNLSDQQERSCYQANIEMNQSLFAPEKSTLAMAQKPWPYNIKAIYQPNKLFHGPDFQTIKNLIYCDEKGGAAELIGIQQLNWPGHWHTDVARIDGVLQLLILWGQQYLNQLTLPTHIGCYTQYQDMIHEDLIRCEFQSQIKDAYHTISQAQLINQDGKIIAELSDVSMYTYNHKNN
ncbi:MAG: SDR family NAD(P)-dependent oxidoreductase [Gammaproteobacteria bacterium]|nr:SDR family NAD(P)-dependent oxidoreductase [Gammaproteobacteria bacterium]